MDWRNSRRTKSLNTAKLALVVMLVVGFLSIIAPLVPVSAGSACRLECCARRAPHAAGSCMDGSCAASLRPRAKAAKNDQANLNHDDPFCGRTRAVVVKSVARRRAIRPSSQERVAPESSAAAVVRPCQPDCGACTSAFTNPNRSRNSTAAADALRPRRPKGIHLSNPGYDRIHILDVLCRQCEPRGPPLFFS